MTNKERFISLCSKIERDGISNLMSWLESTDFYNAPASTRFHGACPGGLLQHSLNVYNEFCRLLAIYPDIKCSAETAIIISLFHDICKADFYSMERRNRKNEFGHWETYPAYKVAERFCFGGHGAKSVYLIQEFIKLTHEEAAAINSHMGAFDNENVGNVYEQFPIAWLLHVADEAATYIREKN